MGWWWDRLIKAAYHVSGKHALYNLKTDISESKDLSSIHKDLAASMLKDLNNWLEETNAQMPRPIEEIPEKELYGKP